MFTMKNDILNVMLVVNGITPTTCDQCNNLYLQCKIKFSTKWYFLPSHLSSKSQVKRRERKLVLNIPQFHMQEPQQKQESKLISHFWRKKIFRVKLHPKNEKQILITITKSGFVVIPFLIECLCNVPINITHTL